jgi:hypothetical protein
MKGIRWDCLGPHSSPIPAGGQTGAALGVSAYVVKPVDFEQLVDAIKQAEMFWAVINEPPPQIA